MEFRVAPDLAEAACSERGEDFVRAESNAGCERHFLRSAVQFITTVIGEVGPCLAAEAIRNRWPSAVTTY